MPLVHRCRYWFTDLFNDFTGDFFVFYLRWLYGLTLTAISLPLVLNVSDFWGLGKEKISMCYTENGTFLVHKNGFVGLTLLELK
jgi:hypothetical protein